VARLFGIAIAEGQAYEKTRGRATREQIKSLEGAVDALASADKWEVRLSPFLKTLKPASARTALKDLVKLGCVADMLVDCLNKQSTEEARRRPRQIRMNEHRTQMRRLSKQMKELADLCDDWDRLRVRLTGGAYALDWKISAFLSNEAQRINAFLVSNYPRTNHPLTLAKSDLVLTMRDIRMITGAYQDRLVAKLLGPVFPTTADALKKIRLRTAASWSRKKPLPTVEPDEFPKLVDRRTWQEGLQRR
jgi:hypothetical protein